MIANPKIYALFDPRDSAIRYIGKSCSPKERMQAHVREARKQTNTHKRAWISSLLSCGMTPVLKIVAIVSDSSWEIMEREIIARARNRGFDLTNLSDGGEGIKKGYKHSDSTKLKLSLIRKGKPLSKEHCRRISLGQIGNKRSPTTGMKISIAKKGKPSHNKGIKMSDTAKQKMVLALTGRKLSWEHRLNLSLAQTGRKHSDETKEKIRTALVASCKERANR